MIGNILGGMFGGGGGINILSNLGGQQPAIPGQQQAAPQAQGGGGGINILSNIFGGGGGGGGINILSSGTTPGGINILSGFGGAQQQAPVQQVVQQPAAQPAPAQPAPAKQYYPVPGNDNGGYSYSAQGGGGSTTEMLYSMMQSMMLMLQELMGQMSGQNSGQA